MTIAILDLTFPTAEENLACDEALLDQRVGGAGGAPAVLRFWEAARPFVVLGYANRLAEEVDADACRALGVPVRRRCTGGGTVLQGSGCLNYSLILPIDEAGPLGTITGANRVIMERHRDALAGLLGQAVTVEGHTDLAVGGRKFSGNAQRRRRDWLLFHGTFLLGFDPPLMEKLLRPPRRQPAYRERRTHSDFLTPLKISAADLKSALARAWQATPEPLDVPHDAIQELAAGRYATEAWTVKF